MSYVMAWLLTLVAGIIVGGVVALAVGRGARAPFWAFVVAGIVGSVIGRLVLAFISWHPSFSGGVLGAIILSLICWAATRGPKSA
jgi:uncharacterized membrane protein YeaQ/YmgE (transglycosylase-associated protein family)